MGDQYDSPWKEVLDLYFRQFLAFFFPEIERDIDWSRGYQSLDKELPQFERDSATGGRYADKLFRVWRLNGEERLVFIHIEVQGTPDSEFPRRMYIYNYRIFDRHRKSVASLAILADEDPNWRPDRHVGKPSGCRGGQCSPVAVPKRRYRQLPAWVEERLGKASREELESWADRVLDAESLDEVFATG